MDPTGAKSRGLNFTNGTFQRCAEASLEAMNRPPRDERICTLFDGRNRTASCNCLFPLSLSPHIRLNLALSSPHFPISLFLVVLRTEKRNPYSATGKPTPWFEWKSVNTFILNLILLWWLCVEWYFCLKKITPKALIQTLIGWPWNGQSFLSQGIMARAVIFLSS